MRRRRAEEARLTVGPVFCRCRLAGDAQSVRSAARAGGMSDGMSAPPKSAVACGARTLPKGCRRSPATGRTEITVALPEGSMPSVLGPKQVCFARIVAADKAAADQAALRSNLVLKSRLTRADVVRDRGSDEHRSGRPTNVGRPRGHQDAPAIPGSARSRKESTDSRKEGRLGDFRRRKTRRKTQIVPRKLCTARQRAPRSTKASADTSESRRIVGNA